MYPSYNQPNYNQLPFPIDRFTAQFVRLAPGQMPFQVNVPCHPNLVQYLPLVGTVMIDAIQSKAQDNQLRIFLFNQMSNNNWMNNDFLGACKALCQYVEMAMSRGQYRDVQSAIYDGAPKIAEMYTAESLRTFPALQQMIDPSLVQRCQATLQLSAQYGQELQQYLQMSQMQQGQQYGGYQQPMQNQQYQQPLQQAWQTTQQPYQAGGGSSPFSSNVNTYQPSAPAPAAVSSTYLTSRSAPAPEPVVPVIQQMPAFQQTVAPQVQQPNWHTPEGTLVKASETKWVPSEKYPFTLTYDPTKNELYYLIEADGSMKPFIKPLTKEEQMERAKHFKSITDIGSDQRVAEFMSDLNATGLPGAPKLCTVDNPEMEGIIVEAKIDVHKTALSDEEIWIEAETQMHARKTKAGRSNAQMLLGYVATPLISEMNPKPLAEKLLNVDNFMEACGILKDAQASISLSAKSKADSHILQFLNNRLTVSLNTFIQKKLSLDITADNFMDDAAMMIEYLEKKKGDKFSDPLRIAQKKIINDAVFFFTGEAEENMYEFYIQDLLIDAEKKPFATFFSSPDVFLSVNLFYSDFKLKLNHENFSVAVFEEHSPLLYAVANELFKVEDTTDEVFTRHLIRTLDRKVIEVHRSVLDPATYLVTLK